MCCRAPCQLQHDPCPARFYVCVSGQSLPRFLASGVQSHAVISDSSSHTLRASSDCRLEAGVVIVDVLLGRFFETTVLGRRHSRRASAWAQCTLQFFAASASATDSAGSDGNLGTGALRIGS